MIRHLWTLQYSGELSRVHFISSLIKFTFPTWFSSISKLIKSSLKLFDFCKLNKNYLVLKLIFKSCLVIFNMSLH